MVSSSSIPPSEMVEEAPEAQHPIVTVVACDLRDYPALCDEPQTLTALLVRLEEAVQRHGCGKVEVQTTAGPSSAPATLTSVAPDARTAIQLAADLIKSCTAFHWGPNEQPVRIRIGISTGSSSGQPQLRKDWTLDLPLAVSRRLEETGAGDWIHMDQATLEAADVRPNAPGIEQRLIRVYHSGLPSTSAPSDPPPRPYDYVLSYFFSGDEQTVRCVLNWGSRMSLDGNGCACYNGHPYHGNGSTGSHPQPKKGPSFTYDVDKHEVDDNR